MNVIRKCMQGSNMQIVHWWPMENLNSNGWTDYWDQLLLTIQISELMEITWIYKDSHTYHLLGKICTQYNTIVT